jgi:hypothetical protein
MMLKGQTGPGIQFIYRRLMQLSGPYLRLIATHAKRNEENLIGMPFCQSLEYDQDKA